MHVSRLDLISCHQNNNVTIVYYVLVNMRLEGFSVFNVMQ